jgi:outer membrane lipopolysaccharide assembly protein LptE/RlpB
VDNANAAETVITVYEESFDRQTGAVGPDGKALEYRLIYSAAISAENAAGETLLERQTLATERSQSYDESAVTGLSNEESQLRSEMALDVAGQFLRRLQALGRAGQ